MASHVWELSTWNGDYSKRFQMVKELAIQKHNLEEEQAESISIFFIERVRQRGKGIDIRNYYDSKNDKYNIPNDEKLREIWLEKVDKELPLMSPCVISKHIKFISICKEKGLIKI